MINKGIRVLIVEPVSVNASAIERVFNNLGYFSIARASCLEEGLLLSRFGGKFFSVLMVSGECARHSVGGELGIDINNVFIHSCSPNSKILNMRVNGVLRNCIGLPGLRELGAFMRRVE